MQALNWDDARILLAVARTGRLVAAARSLALDHTTVARRLTALEQALGTRLVERSPRGTALTAAGAAFVLRAERAEAELLAAAAEFGDTDARAAGSVRLATPEAFGTCLLAPAAARLHARHPDLYLELMPETQLVRLANRDADVAIALNRPAGGPVVARRLIEYRIGLYAAQAYLDNHQPVVNLADLAGHPFAWYIDEKIDLPELRFLSQVSSEARAVFRSTSTVAQHAAVAGGLGLGMLHAFAAERDKRLVRVLADEIEIRRTYWLVVHENLQRLPRIRAVIDFVDEVVGEHRGLF